MQWCSWMVCILLYKVENAGERAYLIHREDTSKSHPGGLKGRKHKQKVVIHHANKENPNRCFIWLFKLYNEVCPVDRPNDSFYLAPLKKLRPDCWFSRSPVGHNSLKNFMGNMCREAGILGYKTNHSLRATAATRLYASGIDEQLVMERTGHRSIEGIRNYKRTSSEQQQNVSDILSNCKRQCSDIVPYTPIPPAILPEIQSHGQQPQTSSITSTTSSIQCMPNLTQSDSSCRDNTGSFHLNSCSNVTINFNYNTAAK